MAPKIVNREQKRLEIIINAYEFLVSHGLTNFSLDALIKNLDMAKGTFYHYFDSKDDLITEMLHALIQDYMMSCDRAFSKVNSLEEKLNILFEVYLVPSKANRDFLNLYQEYLLIYSQSENELAQSINSNYHIYVTTVLKNAFKKAVENGEIDAKTLALVHTIPATIDGLMLYSHFIQGFDLASEVRNYLDTLFNMAQKEK